MSDIFTRFYHNPSIHTDLHTYVYHISAIYSTKQVVLSSEKKIARLSLTPKRMADKDKRRKVEHKLPELTLLYALQMLQL